MTTHAHSHGHAPAPTETPPHITDDITAAAHALVAATNRLGPRITDHGYGCPAQHAGPCICGSSDFLAAMDALKAALLALPGGISPAAAHRTAQ